MSRDTVIILVANLAVAVWLSVVCRGTYRDNRETRAYIHTVATLLGQMVSNSAAGNRAALDTAFDDLRRRRPTSNYDQPHAPHPRGMEPRMPVKAARRG